MVEILKYTGIAGLAISILFLIFKSIIHKNIFPSLSQNQGYQILKLIIILTFIFSLICIIIYFFINSISSTNPESNPQKEVPGIEIKTDPITKPELPKTFSIQSPCNRDAKDKLLKKIHSTTRYSYNSLKPTFKIKINYSGKIEEDESGLCCYEGGYVIVFINDHLIELFDLRIKATPNFGKPCDIVKLKVIEDLEKQINNNLDKIVNKINLSII